MGNMPNRWVGRLAALVVGVLAAVGAFVVGSLVGDRLARGFSFDWFRLEGASSFAAGDVLLAVGIVAGVLALVALALVTGPTAVVTRWAMRRARFTPPRYSEPVGLDVHAGRLFLVLPVGLGLLTALLGFVLLQFPALANGVDAVAQRVGWTFHLGDGSGAIASISPDGYVFLVAAGAAFAAGVTALVAVLSTFGGVASGRIVRESDRNVIARVSLFGMRHAAATVAVVVALTLVAGYFAAGVGTNVDVADSLPRGDPNTLAAHNLTTDFRSSFTQQVTFHFRVLDAKNTTQREIYDRDNATHLANRRTDANPSNITDELYVRAMDQAVTFLLSQPPFAGSVGASDLYRLVNWTEAGGSTSQNSGGNASYALPDTSPFGELQYRGLEDGATRVAAVSSAVAAVSSPDWKQSVVLVIVDPKSPVPSKDVGEAALRARDAWVHHAETDPNAYKAFGAQNPPELSVDSPLGNAHSTDLAHRDITLLLPVAALFIAVTLYIAFRSLLATIVTFAAVLVAGAWTFGFMGLAGIPLDAVDIAVIPLLLGAGACLGIHLMDRYDEARNTGKTAREAWPLAAARAGPALFVATLAAIVALAVMATSPSLPLARLGLAGVVAVASSFVLAVLFVPALSALIARVSDPAGGAARAYQPSRIMPALASGVSRARWLVLVVLLVVAVAGVASALHLRAEPFGDPPQNWPASDALRQENDRALAGFYGTSANDPAAKANVILFEGDITDLAAHKYISNVTATLRADAENGTWTDASGQPHASRLVSGTLRDLPSVVSTYMVVRGGVPGAARLTGAEGLDQALAPLNQKDPTNTPNYPQSQAEMKAVLDEMHGSALHSFGDLFTNAPADSMAVTVYSVRASSYADAKEAWLEVQNALAKNDALRPAGMHASVVGNTATSYLSVEKEVPWLRTMAIATGVAMVALVLLMTRSLRVTLAVALTSGVACALWLGALALPMIDIGATVTLALPLAFVLAMATAGTLPLALRARRTGDAYDTFETVGKAALYSFVTTIGAFLVFTQVSDVSGRDAMIATSLAITIVFLATLAIVPIFFPVRKQDRPGGERDTNVPVVETRSLAPEPANAASGAPTPGSRTEP